MNINQGDPNLHNSLSDTYLPSFYTTTSTATSTGLPPMQFPYGFNNPTLGEPGTWSTNVPSMPSLNPNPLFPSTGFGTVGNGEQLLPDQMFNHNSGVAVSSNAYLGGLNQNNSGLNSNTFLNQPALYFPGSSTEISWGEQTHTNSANPLLTEFYQPPPPDSEGSSFGVVGVNIDSLNGKDYGNGNVDNALSNLSIGVDNKENDVDKNNSGQAVASQPGSAAVVSSSGADSKPKPVSWAAIASQPAKPKPKPPPPKPKLPSPPSSGTNSGKSDSGSWVNAAKSAASKAQPGRNAQRPRPATGNGGSVNNAGSGETVPVLERLKAKHNYNPREFSLSQRSGRFFIIKSYSEDDIHRSIKYSVWTSTEHGNRRLNEAFREQARSDKGPIYLLVSVNGSGHFCGVAQMMSEVDLDIETGIWSQDKWKGKFDVKWYYVKDVPNNALRHIRLENNDNKPVTNSRDTQEVPPEKAKQVLKIIHSYKHQTSIFDDFGHYEKRQEEEFKKVS